MKKTDSYTLGELDAAIVKGVEEIGRYRLLWWEPDPSSAQTELVFKDSQSKNSLLGMSVSIYPVEVEDMNE